MNDAIYTKHISLVGSILLMPSLQTVCVEIAFYTFPISGLKLIQRQDNHDTTKQYTCMFYQSNKKMKECSSQYRQACVYVLS